MNKKSLMTRLTDRGVPAEKAAELIVRGLTSVNGVVKSGTNAKDR